MHAAKYLQDGRKVENCSHALSLIVCVVYTVHEKLIQAFDEVMLYWTLKKFRTGLRKLGDKATVSIASVYLYMESSTGVGEKG